MVLKMLLFTHFMIGLSSVLAVPANEATTETTELAGNPWNPAPVSNWNPPPVNNWNPSPVNNWNPGAASNKWGFNWFNGWGPEASPWRSGFGGWINWYPGTNAWAQASANWNPWARQWAPQPQCSSCVDCTTKLFCSKFGPVTLSCTDPNLPYCNLGECSATQPTGCPIVTEPEP